MARTRPLPRIALLYPGDYAARVRAEPGESRFASLFAALTAAGLHAEPAIYHDDFADEVAAQLRAVDGVLVWCNPIEGGRRRDRLDTLLRSAAEGGTWVSAHPDAVLRLGTKDVLVDTRMLPFGSDVHRVDNLDQLAAELPARLLGGARVLKQYRGHSGIGVWRVEHMSGGGAAALRVRHAQRGSDDETMGLPALLQRMAPYFEPQNGGHMIDQAWQPLLGRGMLRAYLVGDRVAGFGVQAVNALLPAPPGEAPPPPGQRLYHGPDLPDGQHLRQRLEGGWIDQLLQAVGLPRRHLPLLWDCDFLQGEPTAGEPQRWVLCEINVSSVSPFPESAIGPLLSAVHTRLGNGPD